MKPFSASQLPSCVCGRPTFPLCLPFCPHPLQGLCWPVVRSKEQPVPEWTSLSDPSPLSGSSPGMPQGLHYLLFFFLVWAILQIIEQGVWHSDFPKLLGDVPPHPSSWRAFLLVLGVVQVPRWIIFWFAKSPSELAAKVRVSIFSSSFKWSVLIHVSVEQESPLFLLNGLIRKKAWSCPAANAWTLVLHQSSPARAPCGSAFSVSCFAMAHFSLCFLEQNI